MRRNVTAAAILLSLLYFISIVYCNKNTVARITPTNNNFAWPRSSAASPSLQNDDVNNNFKWQSFNTPANQQLYVPINDNNAFNWLIFFNPSVQQQLFPASYQQQQQQQQPADDSRTLPTVLTRPFASSGRGTSRIENQLKWQKYLQSLQNPIYGGSITQYAPLSYGVPFGNNPGLSPSFYSPSNPIYQQPQALTPEAQPNANIQRPQKTSNGGPKVSPTQPGLNDKLPNAGPPRPTPPPLVPATIVNKPIEQIKKLPPLECEKLDSGEGCYALVSEPKKRYADAIKHCKERGMYLARMSESNVDLINRLVTNGLSKNSTSDNRPCSDRITMLGNFDGTRPLRYGSYAFTMGGGNCSTPDTAGGDNAAALFEVCLKEYDCSFTDWNTPNAFVCARDEKNEPWCVEPLASDPIFDYFVTCKPLAGSVAELKYPPMCLPFEYGDRVPQYAKQVQTSRNKTEVSLISNLLIPQIGAIMMCYPSVSCSEPDYKANQYGLCRIEKGVVDDSTTELVQLWPKQTVLYEFVGWGANAANVTRIKEVMSLIQDTSQACLKFRELNTDPTSKEQLAHSGVVQIIPNPSPNTCTIESVGRKSGVQSIIYGSDCFKKLGTLLRPLLHVAGIPAEHTRNDRDKYINVDYANILADPSFLLQAAKQPIPGILSETTPYDFDSVTHFPPYALAKQKGSNPFSAKQQLPKGTVLGQRTHLSEGDKLKLRTLYGECK